MGCPIGQNTLFNTSTDSYIKFQGSDLIAVEGANTVERQLLGSLRFPYKQLLKGRIILKAGQINYLMNHLGLGDNATLVCMTAKYDAMSKIEEDNYVQYNYYPDLTKSYHFAQMLLLTGNSTNRVPQLYLTNPNPDYPVILDVMVAVLDDTYNYFNDVTNQSGLSFTGLSHTDIETFTPNESIVLFDTDRNALVYLNIGSISLLSKVGTIIVIDETSIGKIYLDFISEYESNQGFSLLNYVFNNYGSDPAVVINQQNPYTDITPPVVYFNLNVASASGNPLISMVGSTMSGPYNTSMGMSFSTELYLNEFGTYSNGIYLFDKTTLSELLVSKAQDNRDGLIVVGNNEIILSNLSTTIDTITASGTYSMSFNIVDYASNAVDPNINVELTITS